MLAKTAGVKYLIVLINKMDDPTVEWAEERYNNFSYLLINYFPYLKSAYIIYLLVKNYLKRKIVCA